MYSIFCGAIHFLAQKTNKQTEQASETDKDKECKGVDLGLIETEKDKVKE